MSNKQTPAVFISRLVINRRSKTATLFWQEDQVAYNPINGKGSCAVTSNIKSDTFSYDVRVDIEGLRRVLDLIGYTRNRKVSGYAYTIA